MARPSRYQRSASAIDAAAVRGQRLGRQPGQLQLAVGSQADVAAIVERDDAVGLVGREFAEMSTASSQLLVGRQGPRLFQSAGRVAGDHVDVRRCQLDPARLLLEYADRQRDALDNLDALDLLGVSASANASSGRIATPNHGSENTRWAGGASMIILQQVLAIQNRRSRLDLAKTARSGDPSLHYRGAGVTGLAGGRNTNHGLMRPRHFGLPE